MKVAILSMQEVKNYGSFLQAWALKHTIESLGHTCDFINIMPGKQLGEYKIGKFHKARLLAERLCGWDFFKRLKYIYRFQHRFSKEFLPDLGVERGKVNKNHYDVVVIGSDEVFNCAQKTWFGFSPQLFGDGLNADKVITYAASFGATDVTKLELLGVKDTVARLLSDMDAISVRDANSVITVRTLTGITPEKHVDPVLIYNYDRLMPKDVGQKNYMIVYTYPGRITDKQEIAAIRRYARKHGLRLISIGHYFPWCDDVAVPHPFEVLAFFKKAEFIVTDTFHGSVFSIKYNKNFCTIVRGMNSNKLSHLLKQFGLSERIAHRPDMIGYILDKRTDYGSVNVMIDNERSRSLEYLKLNLT